MKAFCHIDGKEFDLDAQLRAARAGVTLILQTTWAHDDCRRLAAIERVAEPTKRVRSGTSG